MIGIPPQRPRPPRLGSGRLGPGYLGLRGHGLRGRIARLAPLGWFVLGLRSGVLTTGYPVAQEAMPSTWRGVVVLDPERCRPEGALPPCVAACLPAALTIGPIGPAGEGRIRFDATACIACARCLPACPQGALAMTPRFELATRARQDAAGPAEGLAGEGHG